MISDQVLGLTEQLFRGGGSPHLSVDVQAEASRVHHHQSEEGLQQQSHEGVHAEHQGVALHVEIGCDLIADDSSGRKGHTKNT